MFLSSDNKGFLWDLLLENDTFKSEINNNVFNVKKTFESVLKHVEEQNKDVELLEKNKVFLVEMNLKIKNNNLITKEEITKDRVSDFESRLKKRQDAFTVSMKTETPAEIAFSDDMDGPLLNVDDELQKKMKERKYDDTDINSDNIQDGKKWIGLEFPHDISLNKIEEIHNVTPTEIVGDIFVAESELDIFSKLKKVTTNTNSVNTIETILFQLKKMDKKIDMVMEYIENTKETHK